jgi:putative Mn2+ efflux pump MntP
MQYIPYIVGIILILLGSKAVLTQKITNKTSYWDNFFDDLSDSFNYELNGFIAVLLGAVMIIIGITMLVKADPIRKHPQATTYNAARNMENP